jgi:DNA polymerase-3 subunit epsilon/ATP-dependent DNA helicase DinG
VDIGCFYPRKGELGAPPRQEIAPDILEHLFEAREAIAQAFTQYEERPQQIEMAYAVEEALRESQPLVVEAGTGVGKSLAYLLPLAIHAAQTGKLCLVSTNTINLQEQLITLDLPRLRQILDMLDLRVTLLKGREHYVCLKRLQELWLSNAAGSRQRRERYLSLGPESLLFLLRALLLFADDPHGDLDAVPSPQGLSQRDRLALQGSMDCGFQTCLGDRCELKGHCHFFARRAEAGASHIVITNHALVFALHNTSEEDSGNIVARSSVIVFDEAHNLESAITNQNTLEVCDETPVDLGNRLLALLQHNACAHRLQLAGHTIAEAYQETLERARQAAVEAHAWVRKAAEIRHQVNRLLMQAGEKGHLESEGSVQLTPSTASAGQLQVMELLGKLAARFLQVVDRYRETAADLAVLFASESSDLYIDDAMFQMDLQSLGADLADCHLALARWRPEDPGSIAWFNCDPGTADPRWAYKSAPLQVGQIFQGLFSGKDCMVLCSATLTVAGSFDYLQASLGFEPGTVGRTRWLRLASPFDYAQQSLLLVATDMATPTGGTREHYLAQLEEVVAGVCELFPKGVLVLFNSHRDLQHIAARLKHHVDSARILVQGGTGTRAEIAARFRAEGDKVLLATRSFWEGFDVSGEALSCVVLAKLPFANFKDPIHAGRQRAIEAEGGDSFKRYSLPLAAMQLKQGFGRLIRTTLDYGCVFLLDSRAAHSGYGKVFIETLPGPRVVTGPYQQCLSAAERFMDERRG